MAKKKKYPKESFSLKLWIHQQKQKKKLKSRSSSDEPYEKYVQNPDDIIRRLMGE